MKFAIKTTPQETTWQDLLAMWKAADQHDVFESAWNFDHFYPINVPDTHGPCLEAWTTLSALAQATSRIRVGCMVSGVIYRHPALLANMIASLDHISNGRLEIGLGAGWSTEECDAYGYPLGSLKERFDRFDEACTVVHSLLTQETTDFQGKYFQLKNARCEPKPLQKPHPPWCIGGNGEKRTFPNVVRWADHWNYAGFDVEGFRQKRARLHELMAAADRDPATVRTSVHIQVSDDDSQILDRLAAFESAGLDLAIFYPGPPHKVATVARLAELVGRL